MDFKNGEMNIRLRGTGKEAEIPSDFELSAKLLMAGRVQAQNAAAAVTALKIMLPGIDVSAISRGLSKALIPGRFQICGNTVLDGAHTVRSIENTICTLKSIYPGRKYRLLFACAGDKDIKDIIPLFKDTFERIIFTKPVTVRACNPEEMKRNADLNGIKAEIENDLEAAFNMLKCDSKNDDIILAAGSFYLVSELINLIGRKGLAA